MIRPNWHEVEQRTTEWDALRCGKVTGSMVHVTMMEGRGKSPSKTRQDYMAQLATERDTGIPIKFEFDTEDMRNGREREPAMRGLYEQVTGEIVDESIGFIDHPTIPWFGVSPDGLVMPDTIDGYPVMGIEGKCPRLTTFIDRVLSLNPVPKEHFWQCQAFMECAALECVDYVNYHPDRPEGQRLLIVPVHRDQDAIDRMVTAVKLFNEEVEEMRKALAAVRYV